MTTTRQTKSIKVTTDASRLLARTDPAFEDAVADTLNAARAEARKHGQTGKFEGSLETTIDRAGDVKTARLGSSLVSAKVKEKGGFMQGNPLLLLRLAGGEFRSAAAVRVRATPVVTVAGPKFIDFMKRRLSGG
jgi:hypothetical protein